MGWHKVAALQTAFDEIDVPSLVQHVVVPASTLQDDTSTAKSLEGGLNLGEGICRFIAGDNVETFQGTVRVEHAKQTKGAREVVDNFHAWLIVVAVA